MINLFKKDATNFENNGLGSLDQNIINPEISWTDNGAFTLEFKYPLFAKHGKEIENSSIIKANDADGSNLFFVYKITPSMGIVHVLCYQISYKLAFNSINDTFLVEKNGQLALNQLSNATQYPHNFKFFSDIQTVASSRVVRKNPIEFLLDTSLDNCFLNRWGGHIVRQNFNISVNNSYGSNKGYTIRHKKDLKGYEAEFDESTVITKIRPIGYDGLMLPEIYIDSPLINSYPEPRIQQKEYSNVKVAEKAGDEGFATKELAYAELRRLAKLEFSKNKVDIPDFSAKVSFVNLKDTDEYKDLQSLKQLQAGDTVKVVHAEDGFEIEAQMVSYKYNPLNNSYISITLGNYSKSFTSTVSKVRAMQEKMDKVATQSQNAWTAANGKNKVYSMSSFPAITSSSTEGDLLYLKNGDKIELWILEKVNGKLQWVLQVSDATQEELKAQIKDAQKDIAEAVKSANDAVDKANQNIKEIGELDIKLIDTKTLTDKALADVNKIAAENKVLVDKAQVDATKAITDAKTAYDKAVENSGKIVTVNQDVDKIKGEITTKVEKTDFDKSLGRIAQNESSITQNANAITQKVSSTDVENILTGKAYATKSELTQTSNSLTSTISGVRTDVDALGNNLAYAYSADGVDRFTTVYPNLNLFQNSNAQSNSQWNTVGSTRVTLTTSDNVFVSSLDVPIDSTQIGFWQEGIISVKGATYTLSALIKNISSYAFSEFRAVIVTRGNTTKTFYKAFQIPNDGNYHFINFSSTVTDNDVKTIGGQFYINNPIQNAKAIFWTKCPKLEQGSTATPWMPSKTEVKPSDFPSYVGRALKYSTKPSDYKWEINSGYTDAKTDIQQTQISQMVQDLNGFKTTVSDTYLTTANASNTYPTKDAVSGTYLNKGDASNTYPTKTTVTSQINQSATDITNSVQSWTNGKLTGYSTIKQTNDSITSTIAGVQVEIDKKANQSQVTQLSQDLSGFKTTVSSTYLNKTDASNTYPTKDAVANTYPTKTTVATQINQSATDITSSVQSWTNGRLNGYSTIQQTNNSITSAVSGKADRSQVTQLSDQITSVVSSAAQNNLVYNATLQSSDGWLLQNGYTQSSARNLNGNYIINFSLSSNSNNTWYFARSKQVSIGIWKEYAYAAAFMRRSDIQNNGIFMFGVEGFDSNGSRVEFKTINIHSQLTDEKWTTISDMYEFTNSSVKTVCFTLATNSFGHYIACQPIMVNSGSVGNFVADGMDKSQITQLSDQIVSKVSLGEMNSQITQLKNDINLRIVEKGTVTSQINLESGKALISANQILLNADNVKFSGSAFIPSAFIQNLTADKVNTGTLNAANVNVINFNALSITSGTLNSDRIGANSITADKIKATSLDLFSNDSYTNVRSDGMRIQGKAQIVFDNWRDSSNTLRSTQGVYIGGIGGGTKHMAFTRSNGSTFMLRAENGMDYGTNQNVALNQLNIYDNTQFWESVRIHKDLITEGYIAMGTGVQDGSIQYDRNASTMNFYTKGGKSGSYFYFNQKVLSAGSFDSASRLSLKNVKGNYQGSALDDICKTDIVEYRYKNSPNDRQLSPIIDDVNTDKQYHLPDIINDGKTVNLYAMNSLSWLAIKELNEKIEQLEEKLKEKYHDIKN